VDINEQIAYAKKALAKHTGVTEKQIKLPSSESVTWRSGAIGCPTPGGVKKRTNP